MSKDWVESGVPFALFITFRTYGTWLHGDERLSVNRFHNTYGTDYVPANQGWNSYNISQMKGDPVKLTAERRNAVESGIRETCQKRNWGLLALNVRTNHVHIVVSVGSKKPGLVLSALKANGTRKMRETGSWISEDTPWAENGSKRKLWKEKHVERAIDYVINGQCGPLPDFDD